MTIPEQFRPEADRLPAPLRALLDAELAAGNAIAGVSHGFPAPPAGVCFHMAGPVTTRARESDGGLQYNGWFTDEHGLFFILEPPDPPAALRRFEQSMEIDYYKWHDGIGYDLDALKEATAAERQAIETILLGRGMKDWRDVEALAALDTPAGNRALQAAIEHPKAEIRLAVTRYAPHLVAANQRTTSLVAALETARFGSGLAEAIDEAAEYHPPEVVAALFRGALRRVGDGPVHFAALLMYLHGQADEPFDWEQRPFFLRFHTEDRAAREAVFRELCQKVGVDPAVYL